MKKILLFITFLLINTSVFAQELPEISSDRPDQSESPDIVPLRSFQFEMGFDYNKFETDIVNGMGDISKLIIEEYETPEILIRYGLYKKLELRLATSVNITKEFDRNPETFSSSTSDFGPIVAGLKVNLNEEHEGIPSIAFLAEVGMPGLTISGSKNYFNPDLRLCFGSTLTNNFSIEYNIGVKSTSGFNSSTAGLYALSAGLDISEQTGIFAEVYGFVPFSKNKATHFIDGGITFLLKKNIQLDASGGYALNSEGTEYFLDAGVTFRLPN